MTTTFDQMINTATCGNCIDVMKTMPAGSVDFILTDPPYIAKYKDRSRRTVAQDDNSAWLKPAYAGMHRVLKNDAFCVSFYGWPKTGLFFAEWRNAGFRIARHIIFRKAYTSKSAYLQYRHEGAYLLLKGNPAFPAKPLPDVMDWKYTGNKLHPTQKHTGILKPLVETFSKPGDIVLDPFAGSGSTLAAARAVGRDCIGIELDPAYCEIIKTRLATIEARRAA